MDGQGEDRERLKGNVARKVLIDTGDTRIVELPDGTKIRTEIVRKGQEPPNWDGWDVIRR